MKVLVIEDHEILLRNLVRFLALKNIQTDTAYDGKEGLYKALIGNYSLIILDINLPSMSGMEICQSIREKGLHTPILMLTSRSTKSDIISGLHIGADDYISKPFDYDELYARIIALSRRNFTNKSNTTITHKGYILDIKSGELSKNNIKIKLSHLEFGLLKYMLQTKGKVSSRQEIYEKVWGEFGDFVGTKTVDVYIGYLRKKLGKDIIQTKKGYGYIINDL